MTTHSNTLRFTRALLAANLKSTVMLRGAFVMQVAFMALNNLTFFVFWWALMQRVPVLRGWRLGDIQVLFGIVAAGFGLAVTFAGGVRHLGRFIDEGELDTLLTQPRPVLLYALGLRSQASGFGDVLSGIAFIAWSGQIAWRALPWSHSRLRGRSSSSPAESSSSVSPSGWAKWRHWRVSCGTC